MEAYKDQFKPMRSDHKRLFYLNSDDMFVMGEYIVFELSVGNDCIVRKSMEMPPRKHFECAVCIVNAAILKMAAFA